MKVNEDNLFDKLEVFVQTGSTKNMPAEMVEYLSMLDLVRSLNLRGETRENIVKVLVAAPYSLSRYKAYEIYSDSVRFFYTDTNISKAAYRNMYAERLDQIALLAAKTATCQKDLEIAKNIFVAAAEMRQVHVPDPQDIPEELYAKPNKIYVLDPELFGRPKANRRELAQHIDNLPITETDKRRIKADALIEDIDFLEDEETD